ncbi:MAG TPA: CRISPR-associated protein Cas4 [Desulfosporosinus sp.]|nr:CRISPR-associated protein Cas4 [Desulfosporosinus sp.]
MRITGTIVNYFIHCKRQCWLFAHKMNFEDDSEDVRIGRILHEVRSEGRNNTEIQIEGIKVDKMTEEYVIELKKSDADVEATKWQTLYYLYMLKQKGIDRKGRLEFLERKKQTCKTVELELDSLTEVKLMGMLEEVEQYLSQDKPDEAIYGKKCDRCAYYAYCYI